MMGKRWQNNYEQPKDGKQVTRAGHQGQGATARIRKWILASCSLLFLSSFAFAGKSPTASEIVKNIQDNYNQTRDATIRFTQTVIMPLSKISKTIDGTLYLKKGNKYRIETEDNLVVTDGKTSWTFRVASNQVLVDSFRDDKNTVSPDKFLLSVPSDYFVVLLSSKITGVDTTYTLRLTPKDKNSFVRSIKLVVAGNWTVRSAEISDMNDTQYTYTVNELKVNTDLSDSRFEFNPPKGAQVVDLRKH